ncbi:V-type proton ATPase subunit D [Vitis vinifera]|uniref:V-type proton ATPase subunit D n=1 Tax=Vitis vinifera TaxID=29760 RepID=A0A438CZU6_VITVI|nr:V-type proton ATPase subunit D [Vitis vinifera]
MLLGRTSSTLYVLENVQNASLKVRSRQENVADVKVPPSSNISQKVTPRMPSRDWPEVANRSSYVKAIEVLVELASLQTSFLTLDEAIKTTNRRVNALENVVKPRLENTINCIKESWMSWRERAFLQVEEEGNGEAACRKFYFSGIS